ncbi:MAG: hypothetical protein KA765_01415, partial [Thermoflexales bacterium]|nr:hypothetical protein [Thermoflexales bacterium]
MPLRWFFSLLSIFVLLLTTACGAPQDTTRVATAAPLERPVVSPSSVPPSGPVVVPPDTPTPPVSEPPATIAAEADYDIGNPTLTEIYVSPTGDDANSGASPASPLRTLTAAWGQIPAGALTTTGYRINLLPGTYPCEPDEATNCVNQLTNRLGTYAYPVIIRALNGRGTVTLRGGLDIYGVAYVYLIDITLAGGGPIPVNISGNNLLHLFNSDHVLVRGVTLAGPACDNDTCNNLQEVFKVNQAQYLYVEDSIMG